MDLGNIVLGKDEINVGGVNIPILKGDKGENGDTGATGENGYTPVKGVDYWTAEDKQEIIQDVKEEINLDNINQNIATLQTNKADKTELPTKTSELTNDSGFIDNTDFDALELRVDTAETDIETLQGQVETLETQVADLEEQVQELENNQLTGTATGQSIYIEDSTNAKVRDIGLRGNSEQESTTGKNKFDGNAVTTTHTTNWTISFENDILSITHNNSYSTGSPIANLGVLPQGTYIISGIFTREIGLYRDNSYSAVIRNGSTFSVNGTEEIELYFSGSVESGVTDTYKKLQIELGSTATSYEPYTGGQASPNPSYPQEIHSTGDSGSVNEKVSNSDGTQEQNISFPLAQGQKLMEGDYLADDGIHHVMREVVFDGTESVQKYSGGTYSFAVYSNKLANLKTVSGNDDVILCNKLVHTSRGNIWSKRNVAGYNLICQHNPEGNGGYVLIMANNYTTVNELKSWLAEQYANGTPVKVQYELATEVIDPYTEEQQAVWEQIKALRTYKPVTHISSTDEVPATVDVTYVKDLETVINNLGGA